MNNRKLLESVHSIAETEAYTTHEVKVNKTATEGGVGAYYEIDIKGQNNDSQKETNLFYKEIISPGEEVSQYFSIQGCYRSEFFAYNDLSKVFNKLQDEANIPDTDRFKMLKFYPESDESIIILDNAARKGFKILNRMEVIPLNFAEKSVQLLAKYHSLSFVLERRRPDYFEDKIKPLRQHFIHNEQWRKFATETALKAIECLDSEAKVRTQEYIPTFLSKAEGYLKPSDRTKNCLCHGDYRASNLLVKEQDGVLDIIPIDYQTIYYGCPVNDFVYLMFVNTDREFRKKHFIHLKETYYSSLERFLKYFDLDVKDVYTRTDFERDLKNRMDYGLVLALNYFPFYFVENISDMDVSKDFGFKTGGVMRDRMRGLVDDFMEWGYL